MKNLSLIFNAILAVAVGVLFYFQFAVEAPETKKNSVDAAAVDSVSNKLKIAYVHTDSLWDNYKLIDVLQAELELEKTKSERKVTQRTAALEKQLEQMGMELQSKAAKFEQQAQGMNETIRNMKIKELEDLQRNAQAFSAQAEQEMMQLQQSLQQKLLSKESKGTKQVNHNIKDFLQEYNADYNFTYVLAYSEEAGGILLGNPALDITKDVVAGLNAIYDAEMEAEQAAKE
ncbi:MAG: OmpH family outer membrane protein [Flavobacteriales bacterium]|nr:OmpH family outer membrane protein [Flavobacteriales bacterium]